ncbi:MAG: sporulation protein YunB, partial [Christensenellales bacterium]
GTFTGFSFLMGFGPDIEIKFTPIGSANCDFISEFASAGINQTLHKIYITVKAEIYSVSSIYDIQTTVISEVLICENLLIGEIPDTYLSLGRLNLVP